MWRRYIQILSVILLAGLGFFSSFQYWKSVRNSWNSKLVLDDPVSNWEKRVLAVDLPANLSGKIGYVADWDIDPTVDDIGQDEEYVLTQYTLAPLIVERGGGYEWVVGNLTLPGADNWLSQNFRGDKTHFYGLGIYLIHRVKP